MNSARITRILYSLPLPILFLLMVLSACLEKPEQERQGAGEESMAAKYLGRASCRECHTRENDLYLGSDHDLAMDTATDQTVLGDFNNVSTEHLGVISRFYRKDGEFRVRTQGEGGAYKDFTIRYVFGVRPLQQYLVEFPRGAYQMLPYCWDTREAEAGGQRWFHIYDRELIPPEDMLYWTHVSQRWNYMCSECHSTNLRKNYEAGTDSYHTGWSEIDVSCEACHGPGSKHVEWARRTQQGGNPEADEDMGLQLRLKDTDNASWVFNMETGTAARSVKRKDRRLIDMCARCHARRAVISEEYIHGKPLLDTHAPSLLEEGLYFADGQIRDEVYVYGSFLQSKMYREGVVCKDCHEPHSGRVFVQGNALCYRCHLAGKYGSREHHFHDPAQEGSSCVACHMPERTYMVVDPRRDHSLRIPRPDLSDRLKSPNACTLCHADKSNRWAAGWCRTWYGDPLRHGKPYGLVFWAGRRSYPEALPELLLMAEDPELPPMVRATAISLLQNYQDPAVYPLLRENLSDPDPLIRYAAISVLEVADAAEVMDLAFPKLSDPVRGIRIMAAFQLARVPDSYLGKQGLRKRDEVLQDYVQSQKINADHPSAQMNLGVLAVNRGDFEAAEAFYRKAIEIEPAMSTAYVNLADLCRMRDRDREGERILREAITKGPAFAAVNHALGLNLVRQGRHEEALEHLRRASLLEPGNARYAYVYGLGLHALGKTAEALSFLEESLSENPFDRDLLHALSTLHHELGQEEKALGYAEKLTEYYPLDPEYRQLKQYLQENPK